MASDKNTDQVNDLSELTNSVNSWSPNQHATVTDSDGNTRQRSEAIIFREAVRRGAQKGQTAGACPGFMQANVTILPGTYAAEFEQYCLSNPKPCPLLEVCRTREVSTLAPKSDLTFDVPLYNIYKNGELIEQREDIDDLWEEGFVGFVLGCSFSFEEAIIKAGIPLRHIDQKKNVAMYRTNIQTTPQGIFSGPMVVSMRPIPTHRVEEVKQITAQFPQVHGEPIHCGDPAVIGIEDINNVDFGESVEVREDETPVFWACGVTPMAAAIHGKVPFMITHAPGHMLILDKLNFELLEEN